MNVDQHPYSQSSASEYKNPQRDFSRRNFSIKKFLTPGWILTSIVVILFSYVALSMLAPWQLGKNSRTQEFNTRLVAAMDREPVEYQSSDHYEEWTRVILQGHYLQDDQVLLRNRPVQSSPAFQVLTPFQTEQGAVVLVNRGWIPPENGVQIPEIPKAPQGEVTQYGYMRADEPKAEQVVQVENGSPQAIVINSEQIGEYVRKNIQQDYIQLDEKSEVPGLNALPLPQLDSGPYLSYGLQWIAFGIIAPAGLLYFLIAEIRERRRVKEELAEQGFVDISQASQNPAVQSEEQKISETEKTDPAQATDTALYDRYGGTQTKFHQNCGKKNRDRFE